MQPYDVEGLLADLHRMKKENTSLLEERTLLKVAADKYEKRAIYMRKKYEQLSESKSNEPHDVAKEDKLRV